MSDLITLRKKKSSKFYSVDLRIIENSSLSWAAKGVWTYLISRPDGWAVNRSDLLGKSKDGDAALRTILKDLEEAGLLKIERLKVKGRFGPTVWIVSEEPDFESVENPQVDSTQVEKPHVENPHTEKPHVENQHDLESTSITNYLLTNYQDTIDQINTPHTPQGGQVCEIKQISLLPVLVEETKAVSAQTTKKPDQTPAGFDEFYQNYPSKIAKQKAIKAWKALKPSQELQDTILKDVAIRKQNDRRWLQGFTPNPATYLNEKRWEDEIQSAPQPRPKAMTQEERNREVFANYAAKKGVKINGLN